MTVSRRSFMRAGTVAALSAALPLGLMTTALAQKRKGNPPPQTEQTFTLPAAAQQNPLANYTRATFEPYVNSVFKTNSMYLDELVLVEVKETPLVVSKHATRVPVGDNFTLVFRGSYRKRFQQDTYTLEHAALGKFDLFLVPTGLPSRHQLYVAVINRRQ